MTKEELEDNKKKRYEQLKQFKNDGLIRDLEIAPKFLLTDKYTRILRVDYNDDSIVSPKKIETYQKGFYYANARYEGDIYFELDFHYQLTGWRFDGVHNEGTRVVEKVLDKNAKLSDDYIIKRQWFLEKYFSIDFNPEYPRDNGEYIYIELCV